VTYLFQLTECGSQKKMFESSRRDIIDKRVYARTLYYIYPIQFKGLVGIRNNEREIYNFYYSLSIGGMPPHILQIVDIEQDRIYLVEVISFTTDTHEISYELFPTFRTLVSTDNREDLLKGTCIRILHILHRFLQKVKKERPVIRESICSYCLLRRRCHFREIAFLDCRRFVPDIKELV